MVFLVLVFAASLILEFFKGSQVFITIIDWRRSEHAWTKHNNQRSSFDVCRYIRVFIRLGLYSDEEKFL